jgi:hypothetical protein
VSCCCRREGWGKFISELIHAAGYSADAILCRQGGASSTSTMEALLRHRHGCSNPLCREVIRSPRRSEGPWWLLVAGKKLLSSSPTCISKKFGRKYLHVFILEEDSVSKSRAQT